MTIDRGTRTSNNFGFFLNYTLPQLRRIGLKCRGGERMAALDYGHTSPSIRFRHDSNYEMLDAL